MHIRRVFAEKKEKSASMTRQKIRKGMEGVKQLRSKHGHERTHHFVPFNKKDYSIYLQYKNQSAKDPGMPKDLKERRIQCLEWMGRPSPTASPHASDDEGGDEDDYPPPTASPHVSDDEGGYENECENMAELAVDTLLGLNDDGNDDVEDAIVASI